MKYKIEDVYNIAEEIQYYKEENLIKGYVSVNIYDDNNLDKPVEIITRSYKIDKEGFIWLDDAPKTIVDIDWDDVRFEVDEAFFNHFKNADKIWREINER